MYIETLLFILFASGVIQHNVYQCCTHLSVNPLPLLTIWFIHVHTYMQRVHACVYSVYVMYSTYVCVCI